MAHVPPMGFPLETIREELDAIRHPFRIAVMRARNPFNIGTIIRTAHSFLAKEIILVGNEPFYKRAAMGMLRYENVTNIPTEQAFVDHCRELQWPMLAFEKDQAQAGLWDSVWPDNPVLVFGNEHEGLSPLIQQAAHSIIAIPMYGINHSYPVAVAAGMAMSEWARRHYEHGRTL